MRRDDKYEAKLDRRELLGLALLGAAAGGEASAASRAPADVGSDPGAHLADEIGAVLRRTEEIWNSQQFGRLKEVWDAADAEPWYVPEEVAEPFRSWPEIENYWSPKGPRVLDAFRWRFDRLRVKSLAPDLALALFDHYYEYGITPPGRAAQPPLAGFDRCIAIFRRRPEGWRHILYAQCPQGPESYVRVLRERIVTPDFGGFREGLREQRRNPDGGAGR